ncbi:MAG: hypothetical protein ACTSQP_24865 [Promethearchaeota archaeon]
MISMDLEEFQKIKKYYFQVTISIFLFLYILLVFFAEINNFSLYFIASSISIILGLFCIAHNIEGRIDNFFFGYRKKINTRIRDFIKNIWQDFQKDNNCKDGCIYYVENQCNIDEQTFQEVSMRCFYKIIKDNRFEETRSFIFEGFFYFWFFIFTLLLALTFTFAFEVTLLLKTYFALIQCDFQDLLFIFLLQLLIFILVLVFQKIQNNLKHKNQILILILKTFKISFFIIFIALSSFFLYLIIRENIGIENNLYITFYIILLLTYILGLSGKRAKRIKYIENYQIEQFRLITEMEDENDDVTNCLINNICKKEKRERYIPK